MRSVGERCLVGFGNTGGPVMTNVLYNNRYQIVQVPGSVMIEVEMVHDVRIIPIVKSAADARHGPDVIKKWLGDSVGWYEGNTLVVQTRNVNPTQGGYISKDGVLEERFTRWNDNQITYEFTVTDPTRYIAALERGNGAEPDEGRDLRVRLSRRQLRHAQHSQRRSQG